MESRPCISIQSVVLWKVGPHICIVSVGLTESKSLHLHILCSLVESGPLYLQSVCVVLFAMDDINTPSLLLLITGLPGALKLETEDTT